MKPLKSTGNIKWLENNTFTETSKNEAEENFDFIWGHHPTIGTPFLNKYCFIDIPAHEECRAYNSIYFSEIYKTGNSSSINFLLMHFFGLLNWRRSLLFHIFAFDARNSNANARYFIGLINSKNQLNMLY